MPASARATPGAYDHVLTALDPARRRAAEGTPGGLRSVRNWMGYRTNPLDFFRPPAGTRRR